MQKSIWPTMRSFTGESGSPPRDEFAYPMYGFIHVCGRQVEYRATISAMIPPSEDHYEGALARRVRPESWLQNREEKIRKNHPDPPWKTVLVITDIKRVSHDTCSFKKKKDGTSVQRPPQSFVGVLLPDPLVIR